MKLLAQVVFYVMVLLGGIALLCGAVGSVVSVAIKGWSVMNEQKNDQGGHESHGGRHDLASAETPKLSHAAHTPGPWEWFDDELHNVASYNQFQRSFDAARDENGDVEWSDVGYKSEPIIQTDSGVYGPRGLDRNLIAAAPDLLEALKHVMGWIESWSPSFTEDREWPEYEYNIRKAIAKAEGRS